MLNAEGLGKDIHENGIKVVLLRFHEVMVKRSGPSMMTKEQLEKDRPQYQVSKDLRAFLDAFQFWGVAVYVFDISDARDIEKY